MTRVVLTKISVKLELTLKKLTQETQCSPQTWVHYKSIAYVTCFPQYHIVSIYIFHPLKISPLLLHKLHLLHLYIHKLDVMCEHNLKTAVKI